MVEVEIMEFQSETRGPSTTELRANSASDSSAQDDTVWVESECLEHGNREFKAMLRVLAEC